VLYQLSYVGGAQYFSQSLAGPTPVEGSRHQAAGLSGRLTPAPTDQKRGAYGQSSVTVADACTPNESVTVY